MNRRASQLSYQQTTSSFQNVVKTQGGMLPPKHPFNIQLNGSVLTNQSTMKLPTLNKQSGQLQSLQQSNQSFNSSGINISSILKKTDSSFAHDHSELNKSNLNMSMNKTKMFDYQNKVSTTPLQSQKNLQYQFKFLEGHANSAGPRIQTRNMTLESLTSGGSNKNALSASMNTTQREQNLGLNKIISHKNTVSQNIEANLLNKLKGYAQASVSTEGDIKPRQPDYNSAFNLNKEGNEFNGYSANLNQSIAHNLSLNRKISPTNSTLNISVNQQNQSKLFTSLTPNYSSNPYIKSTIFNPAKPPSAVIGEKTKRMFMESLDQASQAVDESQTTQSFSNLQSRQLLSQKSSSTSLNSNMNTIANLNMERSIFQLQMKQGNSSHEVTRQNSGDRQEMVNTVINTKPPLSKQSPNTQQHKYQRQTLQSSSQNKESSLITLKKISEINTFQDVIKAYKPLIQSSQNQSTDISIQQSQIDPENSGSQYSFQKYHPAFNKTRNTMPLNFESSQKMEQDKKQADQKLAEQELKKNLEKEKAMKQLGRYQVMNINEKIINKESYTEKKQKEDEIRILIKERFKEKLVQKCVFIYKCRKYKIDIAKYFSQYCIALYRQIEEEKEARKQFDLVVSDDSPLTKKKNKVLKMKQEISQGQQEDVDELVREEYQQQFKQSYGTSMYNMGDNSPFQEQFSSNQKLGNNQIKRMNLREKLAKRFKTALQSGGVEEVQTDQENEDFNQIIEDEFQFQDLTEAEKLIKIRQQQLDQMNPKRNEVQNNLQKNLKSALFQDFKRKKAQIKFVKKKVFK
ncbi:UNKNOWN [Stylonychia lemnae]|uniref:Uncharacterized protein n=1 Tax=Stylonychia lemnae TaxID=5949 RepID=A0A078A593_STYLE|nr:UNKNOWN [Stylonychia lemnae]|eukprot:CDW77369.1 UNKNOWN [Stylonychia lemnae]